MQVTPWVDDTATMYKLAEVKLSAITSEIHDHHKTVPRRYSELMALGM
jgi:hypothetical protein